MTASAEKITPQNNVTVNPMFIDPWQGWNPCWTEAELTPQDWQETHSPSENTQVKLPEQKNSQAVNRRIVDARLWESMTADQQSAAIKINLAFEMMSRGMGYAQSNWQRIPGCKSASNIGEAHARMINVYIAWAKECAVKKISHSMAVDVLCFGFSCQMIDCDRRLRKGSTRCNLLAGLTLYCELRGWK